MKKLLVLAGLILSVFMYAQAPLEMTEEVDEFTGEVIYNLNQVCLFEKGGKEVIALLPSLNSKGKLDFLGAFTSEIGCLDNAQIYILFDNGEVINKRMFNNFNCDGIAGFMMNKKDWEILGTHKIDKVKLSSRGKSIIGVPTNPEYFIQANNLIN